MSEPSSTPATVDLEEWRPVSVSPFEHLYTVSSFGRLRSERPSSSRRVGYLLRGNVVTWGYIQVALYNVALGTKRMITLHRIVCEAFHGPHDSIRRFVNHKDGNKLNNRADNLEWVTHSENVLHAYRTGLNVPKRGEASGSARLRETDIPKIRQMVSGGMSQQKTGEHFGVSKYAVACIIHGRTWAHV